MSSEVDDTTLLRCTTDIVTALIQSGDSRPVEDLIALTHKALRRAASGLDEADSEPDLIPAIPVADSLTDEAIICLEDGQSFQSLKRHLRVKYNLTPDEYRAKWGLPVDYPMVAPAYAKRRSELAKRSGLGRQKRN